jgi:diamine N-acetyltransferase
MPAMFSRLSDAVGDVAFARIPAGFHFRYSTDEGTRRGRRVAATTSATASEMTTPDFLLAGERAALGPLRRDLAGTYACWMNQPEVRRGLEFMGIATTDDQEKWVAENLERGAEHNPKAVEFTIYDRSDSAPVGTAGLYDISHARRRAAFAIAIGERRGQGLGTAATGLVLDFAFDVLRLESVMLETLAWNVAALTAYERAGFRRLGVRRGTDLVLMDAVPSDRTTG